MAGGTIGAQTYTQSSSPGNRNHPVQKKVSGRMQDNIIKVAYTRARAPVYRRGTSLAPAPPNHRRKHISGQARRVPNHRRTYIRRPACAIPNHNRKRISQVSHLPTKPHMPGSEIFCRVIYRTVAHTQCHIEIVRCEVVRCEVVRCEGDGSR